MQRILILGAVFTRVIELEGSIESVAEIGFPVAVYGSWVGSWLGEVGPGFTAVVGVGDCDAEEGVGARSGVFAVVSEGAEDAG